MKPLITISGKTCSGKTFLLNRLLETGKFSKLVTTTTRAPREGEIQGVDYHFISSSLAEYLINTNKFIESNVHSNQIYGLTSMELHQKLEGAKVPIVILTPNGVEEYKRQLAHIGIRIVPVFIDCPQDLLLARLAERTAKEDPLDVGKIKIAFERLIDVHDREKYWEDYLPWDKVISAGDPNAFNELLSFLEQFQKL